MKNCIKCGKEHGKKPINMLQAGHPVFNTCRACQIKARMEKKRIDALKRIITE